jgi:hypothetical protein
MLACAVTNGRSANTSRCSFPVCAAYGTAVILAARRACQHRQHLSINYAIHINFKFVCNPTWFVGRGQADTGVLRIHPETNGSRGFHGARTRRLSTDSATGHDPKPEASASGCWGKQQVCLTEYVVGDGGQGVVLQDGGLTPSP